MPPTGKDNQLWIMKDDGHIKIITGNKVLGVADGITYPGSSVMTYEEFDQDDQKFRIIQLYGGNELQSKPFKLFPFF